MIHTIDLHFQGLPQAIASFVVPTEDGPVVIETGPHSTLPYLEEGLKGFGYELSDIKHVLLSHIHLDHAGAAWCLAAHGAKIYVHSLGHKHLNDPSRLMASAKLIYGDKMNQLWGSMEAIDSKQLVEIADDEKIVIGNSEFKPWYTPGHAKHHLVWQLGDILFAGDVAGVRIGDGPVMPPCPPPDIDIEVWIQSIELIRGLRLQDLYLTHFGSVSNISTHLDQFEERLHGWAHWIKPYWEARTPASEITGPFQDFVVGELRQSGLSESEIAVYEVANPSWMSVYGLLRYWDKRQ